jgi:hypothetical protein
MPGWQIPEPQISDSKTDKMFDAVSNSFKHPANLPIYSLSQHDAQTRRRDGVDSHNLGPLAVEKNSAQQFRREGWIPRPIQCHLIFLLDFVTWVSQPLCQIAIICEKKEPLSLRVQAPNIEEMRKLFRKQIKDSIASVLIFSGRDESGGFVQHDGKYRSDVDKFAIDFDVIAGVRLCAKVCADLTVDGDPARRDQVVTISPRTNTGSGEKTVEAQEDVYKS